MSQIQLTEEQARVIAALVEKSLTTPQYYPMTVNALLNACNQKSCRNPVMKLSEGEVGATLHDLEDLKLAGREENSGRTVKWKHRFQHQMMLKRETMGVLVTLMLRGPQTLSELRSNASGLGGPSDGAELAAVLDDLEDRATPLIVLLPKASGQKEARYAHLLCGEPVVPEYAPSSRQALSSSRAAEFEAALVRLNELERRVAHLERQAGIDES